MNKYIYFVSGFHSDENSSAFFNIEITARSKIDGMDQIKSIENGLLDKYPTYKAVTVLNYILLREENEP